MDDQKLVQAYFGGVTSGDYFPKGKRDGIYIPDWDSEFVVTLDGRAFMGSFSRIGARLLSLLSVRGRAARVLRRIDENRTMHEISDMLGDRWVSDPFCSLDGTKAEAKEFTVTVTWLLQRGYIMRVIDRSI